MRNALPGSTSPGVTYPGVIAASDEGIALAGDSSVSAQLFAQKAKGWARLGDRRMAWVALEEGRRLLGTALAAGQHSSTISL